MAACSTLDVSARCHARYKLLYYTISQTIALFTKLLFSPTLCYASKLFSRTLENFQLCCIWILCNKNIHTCIASHDTNRKHCVSQAGLDSLAAVELRNAAASKFGVQLPATVTFDYPTLASLAAFVAGLVAVSAAEADAETMSPLDWQVSQFQHNLHSRKIFIAVLLAK